MANYNVDIEVALRGARELKVLKDSLKGVNKEVGRLNAATIKAGKALKGTFSAKDIGNVNNYSKAVANRPAEQITERRRETAGRRTPG